jgi:hypothetical protein
MIRKIKLTSDGMAIITVLLLTVLLALMTVSMVFISTNHVSMIGNIEGKEKALKAAEAGIEYAIYNLNNDSAWGLLNESVTFQDGKLVNLDPNSGTFPVFTYGNSDVTEDYTDDCKFTITFASGAPYRSVNNLFNPLQGDGNTPAYTCKIVSVGKYGIGTNNKSVKILEAYLVRSDYSPQSINIAGPLSFTGNDANSTGNVTILGRDVNEPGSIYSGSCDPNDPTFKSISSGEQADVSANKGIFIARGSIKVPPDFNGSKVEFSSKDCLSKPIRVNDIINSAANDELGPVSKASGGTLSLQEERQWDNGTYYSTIILNNTSGFTSSGANPDITYNPAGDVVTLRLNKDIYVSSGELKITGNADALKRERYYGWYDDGHHSRYKDTQGRSFYLNLNGHSIYSEGSVKIGVNVIGKGRIFSKQDVEYLVSINTDETVTACSGNLELEISKTIGESNTAGLYYASGNMEIGPLKPGGDLDWTSSNDVTLKEFPAPVSYKNKGSGAYASVTKFSDPTGKTVSIGQYEPPKKDKFGNIIQPEYYYGNGLLVKKVINVKTGDFYYIAKGADHDNNDSDHLQISLDYEGRKNIDLGHYKIKIIPPAGSSTDPNSFDPNSIDPNSYDPNSFDPNDPNTFEPNEPQPHNTDYKVELIDENGDPVNMPAGVTQDELDNFAAQSAYYFNLSSDSVDITMVGAIKAGDKDKRLFFNPGPKGNVVIGYDPSYMNSLVNIQKKFFTVRKIACYEL